MDAEDKVGESPYSTYVPNSTNDVSHIAIFGAFATIHLPKSRMSDLKRHTKLDVNTWTGVFVGLTPPGRSRKGVLVFVSLLEKVVVVRQCNLDPTFLPYRKTNRRIQPFDDPGFPESLRTDLGGPRDLIGELAKDFPEIPPEHDHDGRADLRILRI